MGRKVMSQRDKRFAPRDHLVEYRVPDYHLIDYYKKIADNGPLYTVLSVTKQDSRVFFSPYRGSKNEFVSYVFFREQDALKYLEVLRKSGYITEGAATVWKSSATGLVASYKNITEKEKSGMTGRKFHAIASIYLHDEFREVEYFWTDDINQLN